MYILIFPDLINIFTNSDADVGNPGKMIFGDFGDFFVFQGVVDGPGASQTKMVQLMVRWTIVQILLVVLVVMVSMMVQLMKLKGIRTHAIFV